MSVRRLAEDAVQPDSFAFTADNANWAEQTIRKYPEGRQQSAVIPLLMRAQDQDGWVTRAAIEHVAGMLRMPLIRVLEVATFYTQFQLKPVGTRAHVQVCGTTPCMLRGSDDLKAVCRERIHSEQFHLNEAGTLSWEEVECLGACVNAPMVMIFKDTYEDLTAERLEEIIDLFEKGEGETVRPGPQIDRHLSAPIGGLTSLADEGSAAPSGQRAAAGAASQGEGAGDAANVPPSKAGRPTTNAPETDPTIAAPGKAANGNASQAGEKRESDSLVANGHKPNAGRTGGTVEGPTGASKEDEARARITNAEDAEEARTGGTLEAEEAAAEAAVVPDQAIVDDGAGPRVAAGAKADLTGRKGRLDEPVEAKRVSDDVTPGPAADDHFDSKAEDAGRKRQASGEPHMLERDAPRPIGTRPEGLLDAPQGRKDDLKRIKGVGAVLEEKLNELGIFHVRQIAALSNEELIWVDDHLNFRGRAVRDRWIEQAKAIEAGAGEEK